MRAMSPRESRLVAVLILIALLAALLLGIVEPILSGFAARADRRDGLLLRYAVNQRTIAAIPRLRRQAEARRGVADDFTLNVVDPAAAGELLKERLQRAVEGAGGEFHEGVDVPTRPGWIAERITARLSQAQLGSALALVQNQKPYVIIDSLQIAADDALIVGHPSALDVQFDALVPLRAAAAR